MWLEDDAFMVCSVMTLLCLPRLHTGRTIPEQVGEQASLAGANIFHASFQGLNRLGGLATVGFKPFKIKNEVVTQDTTGSKSRLSYL